MRISGTNKNSRARETEQKWAIELRFALFGGKSNKKNLKIWLSSCTLKWASPNTCKHVVKPGYSIAGCWQSHISIWTMEVCLLTSAFGYPPLVVGAVVKEQSFCRNNLQLHAKNCIHLTCIPAFPLIWRTENSNFLLPSKSNYSKFIVHVLQLLQQGVPSNMYKKFWWKMYLPENDAVYTV